MKFSIRRIGRRRRRAPVSEVEGRLRRYGRSLRAPAEVKAAGLKRLLAEMERAKRDRNR